MRVGYTMLSEYWYKSLSIVWYSTQLSIISGKNKYIWVLMQLSQ